MPNNGIYRVVTFGPTGSGKSQLCNFFQKDLDNNINKVSNSLNSCTQDPQSNIFKRGGIDIDLIDTAGSGDSGNKDEENLEKVCKFLRTKEQIDYIILLLSFSDRLQKDTRDYIKTLGNMFTLGEFYSHFCVVFSRAPLKETKKNKEAKKQHREEVAEIINQIFGINDENKKNLPEIQVYFIDTEIEEDDDENKKFNEKSQKTIDVLIEHIKLNSIIFPEPIITKNIDLKGVGKKLREEEQARKIKELEEQLKQQELKHKRDEDEKKRLRKEIQENQKDKKKLKQKEFELKEIERKQNEEKLRLEKREEDIQKNKQAIEKLCKDNNIDVQRLNSLIDGGLEVAKVGGVTTGVGTAAVIGGAILTIFCPFVGPFVMAAGAGVMAAGTGEMAVGGVTAGVTKIIKEAKNS